MKDLIGGVRIEGELLPGGYDIYDPGVDVVYLRRRVDGLSKAESAF